MKTSHPTISNRVMLFGIILSGVVICSILYMLHGGGTPAAPEPIIVEKQVPIEMVEIVMSTTPIERGRRIESSAVTIVRRPKQALGEGVITSLDQVRDRYARIAIPAGQILVQDFITDVRQYSDVVDTIPEHSRAIAINVDATTGVEGWARAGALVDVLWITEVDKKQTAKFLVQAAKVLSAERKVDPDADQSKPIPTTVTLMVLEKDAQRIVLAQTKGKLVLHLRGTEEPLDSGDDSDDSAITPKDLLPGGKTDKLEGVEGYVRLRGKDGVTEEWAVVKGKLYRKE